MHKIIVGTPRSGTSFVTKWYVNECPEYTALGDMRLFEYFDPIWFKARGIDKRSPHQARMPRPHWLEPKYIDRETRKRIRELPPNYIFKMHTGPDMSECIWRYIYKVLVILVKRKDLLGQFISYGIGRRTLKWVWYPQSEYNPKWKLDGYEQWEIDVLLLKTKCTNGLEKGEMFYYKKQWFDDLVWCIEDLEKREHKLKIERTVWFEDLPNFPNNGDLMARQNPQSNDEKLNLIVNKNEFLGWFKDWTGERNNENFKQ